MSEISRAAVADTRAVMRVVRDRRIRAGLSVVQVAELIGVAASTYALWEGGAAFPTSRHLAAALRAVGLRLAVAHAEPETVVTPR